MLDMPSNIHWSKLRFKELVINLVKKEFYEIEKSLNTSFDKLWIYLNSINMDKMNILTYLRFDWIGMLT